MFGSGTVRRRVGEIFKIERYTKAHSMGQSVQRYCYEYMCYMLGHCNMVLCVGALYHVCVEMGYLMFASVDGGKKDILCTY